MNDMSNDSSAIYLFCFAQRHRLPVLEVAGMDHRHPVSLWPFKDIVAVLSGLSLEEFCGPEAESRMKDLSWLGPRASCHEEVVEQAMRHSPVFPARFGTLFSSSEALERFLHVHCGKISQFLDLVAERDEWSVKGLIDRATASESLLSALLSGEAERLAALSPGRRYLHEQRIRSAAEKALDGFLKEVLQSTWKGLNSHACDFCERDLLSLAAGDMEMVVNWAFLVQRETAKDFRIRIDRSNEEHARQGLLFQLSGPWPPYSFRPALEVIEA
jgi:hypothetical protein